MRSPRELADELGWRAQKLRTVVLDELTHERAAGGGPLSRLHADVGRTLAQQSAEEFADAYAQTVSYGLFAARWMARDPLAEFCRARAASLLPSTSEFLRALFDRLIAGELAPKLRRLLDDIAKLLAPAPVSELFADASDPTIHFYQDFLDAYDPSIRRRMGVFYTPDEVVDSLVAFVDERLRARLGLRLGLADPIRWREYADARGIAVPEGVDDDAFVVQILDPATGTGTFLLRVIERVHETMFREYVARGLSDEHAVAEWNAYVRDALLPRINGFELMMAPYVVSHLRLGLALEQTGFAFDEGDRLRVFLTNTLALAADDEGPRSAGEALEAEQVKQALAVMVVLGNPPYERIFVDADPTADWIVHGKVPGRTSDKSLFDDIRDVAREHTIFSHLRSLPDRYVYFWRWALWKTFEHPQSPGIVAFVSNGTWLSGPGFVGLRKLAREACDEIWTVDLGGDKGGTRPEPNVFNIGTPVAITTLVRASTSPGADPARGFYLRIVGESVEQKLGSLRAREPVSERDWQRAPAAWLAPLVPPAGDSVWLDYPALADLFPWQQPGCLAARTWPIAPDPCTLRRRWASFVGAPVGERPTLFSTAKTGRNIHTKVPGYASLASLDESVEPERIVRYCLRSFDRQWIFDDPRLLKTESPSLWRSSSDAQLFLCSLMSAAIAAGPALTVATFVPDFHHFRGSYGGKDVMPLYRDRAATEPNVTAGLLARLGDALAIATPTPEDLAAYVYALLASPSYHARFEEPLRTPGPRVPITRDVGHWARAVALGKRLIWLHSYAERFCCAAQGRGRQLPAASGLEWIMPVTSLPRRPSNIAYDAKAQILSVGDGRVAGVREAAWAYSVSGMQVVKKWLGYRTASGTGRAASSSNPLDRVRPKAWVPAWSGELIELLTVLTLTIELQPEQAELLDAICAGPRIVAGELPRPTAAERQS